MNAIRVLEIEKRYGALRALSEVSFELPSGSATLVCGPNGAGKSTLLRVLAGLTRPTSGSVRLLERNPFGREGRSVRGAIGWLGPEVGLYADLTVEENLAFAARLHAVDAGRVEGLVKELGLETVRARQVRTLSQGYRRRAGLARALVHDPRLLFLDEPWNGLDDEAAERLSGLLRARRDRGDTVVVAAHRGGALLDLADRVIRLDRGRLVAAERIPPGDASP